MQSDLTGLSEFILINNDLAGTSSSSTAEVMFWDVNSTKMLLDLYKQYRSQVGSMKIRSIKHMWKLISQELSAILNKNITENHCENRWRVLDRNYKKYVDGKNSTGSGRKFFEYATEMEDLFGHKRNVRPEILLGSDTIVSLENNTATDDVPTGEETSIFNLSPAPSKMRTKKRRIGILEQIRQDRLEYQRRRLEQEDRKIALLERNIKILEKQFNVNSS